MLMMHQTVVSTLRWLTNKYQLNELKVFSKLSNALYDIAGFFVAALERIADQVAVLVEAVAVAIQAEFSEGAATVVGARVRSVVTSRSIGATGAVIREEARSVVVRCVEVVVARRVIGATRHFLFVAHAIAVGVVDASTVTINVVHTVDVFREHTFRLIGVGR